MIDFPWKRSAALIQISSSERQTFHRRICTRSKFVPSKIQLAADSDGEITGFHIGQYVPNDTVCVFANCIGNRKARHAKHPVYRIASDIGALSANIHNSPSGGSFANALQVYSVSFWKPHNRLPPGGLRLEFGLCLHSASFNAPMQGATQLRSAQCAVIVPRSQRCARCENAANNQDRDPKYLRCPFVHVGVSSRCIRVCVPYKISRYQPRYQIATRRAHKRNFCWLNTSEAGYLVERFGE